jgi:hypothetical protein
VSKVFLLKTEKDFDKNIVIGDMYKQREREGERKWERKRERGRLEKKREK